ncbi:phenylacetate-CoA ligase [Syntrophobotulus glycolicus DSM 8271]|uniref:Phenylacetate-coenzyme A ligase n=1 Tax=Syntrophobotulus glycolicus (strain DSM 8271 / FlGlyR) TaxID=645991 RepID=F0SW67_SYNGF|nr:phenylacetate--CoA ligase [Syntrophobotulus glycolicus]ADY54553.1 phenylacetate-CoA ligase [Syntrophobotulus glycolicus DSM 8271]
MLIWDQEHECMPRPKLNELQLERLKWTVNRVYSHVPHYRKKFDELGIKPESIKSLKDLARLPFTTKNDLRDNYPFGLFTVPARDLIRIHASSGTTGRPVVAGYTANDLNTWTELTARMVTLAGVTKDDVAQIAFNYGLFTGGFGLHYGLERVGALVIPASGGNTERQLMLMQDFGTTTLIATPSYALYIAEVAEQSGIDIASLKLKTGLFGSEPWTEEMRKEIESRLHLVATDNYGLSEVMGPGVAGECLSHAGHHIAEDHFIVETINPDTGEILEPGEEGELVFTSLTKEAFPVIRFRTKDISCIDQEPCSCGRTTARMRKVTGRTDDMLIIRGVNVFPSQIESILMPIEGIGPHYLINVSRKNYLDELEVVVELTSPDLLEPYSRLEEFEDFIRQKLYSVLSLHARIRIVQPGTLERTTGKSKRVFDSR